MLTWTENNPRIGPVSYFGKLGKWDSFKITWGNDGKGYDRTGYYLFPFLPGIKTRFGPFKRREDAQARAEAIAAHWIGGAELIVAPQE